MSVWDSRGPNPVLKGQNPTGVLCLSHWAAGTQWKSSPPIGQKTHWDHGLGFDLPALEETGWPFNWNSIQHQPLRKTYQTEPVLPPCKLHDLGRLVTSILLILICKYDPTLKDNLECKQESIAAPYVNVNARGRLWGVCILSTQTYPLTDQWIY